MENKSFGSFEKLDVLYHFDDKTLDSVALKFQENYRVIENEADVYSLLNSLIYYLLSYFNREDLDEVGEKKEKLLNNIINNIYDCPINSFKEILLPNCEIFESLGIDFEVFCKDFQKKITNDLIDKNEFKEIKNFGNSQEEQKKLEIKKRYKCDNGLLPIFNDDILVFLDNKNTILEEATNLAQVSLKNWEYLFEYFEKMNKDLDFFKKLIDPQNLNSSFAREQNFFKFIDSSGVNLLDNIFFNKYKFEMLNGILIENYPENFKEFFREQVNNIPKEDYMTQKKTQGLFSANFERFFNELNPENFTIKNTSKNSYDTRNPLENMRWELMSTKGRYSFSFASTQEENSLKIEIRVSNGKDYIYEFKDNYLSFKVKKEKAFILDNYYFYFNSEEECALSILMWIYGATEIKENEIYKKLRSKKSDESKP